MTQSSGFCTEFADQVLSPAMANVSFSFPSSHQGCVPEDRNEEKRVAKGVQEHRGEDVAVLNPFFSGFGSRQENLSNRGVCLPDQSQLGSNPMVLDHFNLDVSYPATSGSEESPEFGNKQKMMMPPSSKETLELLSSYWTVLKKSKRDEPGGPNLEVSVSQPKLSAEEIMRVAGTRYIQFQHQGDNHLSMLTHPFGPAFSCLSEDDLKEVELAQLLLAAAEKVDDQQFDRASRLFSYCELLASKRASPAQRIVLYFVEALRDRIDKQTGRTISTKGLEGKASISQGLSTSLTSLKCHAQLPFNQVTQFTALQVIIEHTVSATRIHLIDLQIRSGIQWMVLMHALTERKRDPVELLKITAVGSAGREKMEEAGQRLASVAESMNIPFLFQVVFLSNLEDIREEQFNLEDGEAIAVYAPIVLRTMISSPTSLEKMFRVIRNLNPSVMVMTEVEANHNSPSFVARFIEALFFYSAFFDCLETCMIQEAEYKTIVEEMFSYGIRNIISTEGHERFTRNVKIEVWRAFFARYRMVELELSEASLYQATLITKQFACERFCTLDRDGNSLLVGWKGTPILSFSAWKFG